MELDSHPGSLRMMKKPLPSVRVRFAQEAGIMQTPEGKVTYQPGDALLHGMHGDDWPVAKERFFATYVPLPPTQQGEEGLYSKRPIPVWGLRVDTPFCVRTGGNTLSGKAGDWLIQYSPAEYGIIDADIFVEYYTLLGTYP